jgi:hypothetical protein
MNLQLSQTSIDELSWFYHCENQEIFQELFSVIEKYGKINEINCRCLREQALSSRKKILSKSPYLRDLEWLEACRDNGKFITVENYRKKILGRNFASTTFSGHPTTLEISACNYFPWLIAEARQSISQGEIMPARYIRVRSMKEQLEDLDLVAFHAAMAIIGASCVQTLGTKGTQLDESGQPINCHLAGVDSITGYFGGVGVPNKYALQWVDEFLHYYTEYGVQEVLNVNFGTIVLGFMLYKLGVDIHFKVSVFMGIDNPYSFLGLLTLAKLYSRPDGSTPLVGLNLSNSSNNDTILKNASVRKGLQFEEKIRIEHHITEAYKSIVRQPYDRSQELLSLNGSVRNLSAKHEGGLPAVELTRKHPSDILDYFLPISKIRAAHLEDDLLQNYMDKHSAVNLVAATLTQNGLSFFSASNLHTLPV